MPVTGPEMWRRCSFGGWWVAMMMVVVGRRLDVVRCGSIRDVTRVGQLVCSTCSAIVRVGRVCACVVRTANVVADTIDGRIGSPK